MFVAQPEFAPNPSGRAKDGADVLLEVKNLSATFEIKRGTMHAVDDVSFSIRKGEVLGLVGESGSGKTLTALSILRLQPSSAQITGQIIYHFTPSEKQSWLEGEPFKDLAKLSESQLKRVRGKEIAMIFQDPLSSLNPVHRVGDQIVEAIRLHRTVSKRNAWREAVELMRQVGIQSPEKRARNYPHQLSGGMRQRIMIAMALSCRPKLLIADEPTTMIDEISQMQIIELLRNLKDMFGSILYITHDLGVVAELCTRVAVIYAGRIVETGDVNSIFSSSLHPYTRMLLDSIPRVDKPKQKLVSIPGAITPPINPKAQCRFVDRCPYVAHECREQLPELEDTMQPAGHFSACIRWREIFAR